MFPRLHLRLFARFALAWFALALCAAAASAWVNPPRTEWVCSAEGGGHWVTQSDGGTPAAQAHSADCALCLFVSAPPGADLSAVLAHAPLSGAAFSYLPLLGPEAGAAVLPPPRGPPFPS